MPRSRELVVVGLFIPMAVLLGKGGIGVEVGEEVGIVAFHDDAHGDDETPDNCPGILANSFERREVMLSLSTETSLVGGIVANRLRHRSLDIVAFGVRNRRVDDLFAHCD